MERITIAMQDGGAGAGARHEAAARAARLTSFFLSCRPTSIMGPPVGGTFHFEISVMPALTKTCPKMVLPLKGGRTEGVFEKKFSGAGEDSAVGVSASA